MAVWSKIKLSDVINYTRIDGDFYKPEYLEYRNVLKNFKNLSYYINEIIHPGEFKRIYSTEGVSVLRAQNVRPLKIEVESNSVFIPKEVGDKLIRNKLIYGDILITRTGANFGQTALYTNELENAIVTSHTFILKTNNRIESSFLALFLNTKYGRKLLDQGMYGSSQPEIAPKFIKIIPVPRFETSIEKKLSFDVIEAYKLRQQSKSLYRQATDLLEQELGLDKITFEKKKSYVASFSEVATTRRMNAEYFSPSVKNILYQPFLTNSKPIGALFQIVRGTTPKQYFENGFPVIKTKNIRVPEIDRERVCDFVLSTKDLTTIQEDDLLLASMGVGSLGRMSYILSLDEDTVVDGTIRVFRRKSSTPINYEIPTLLFLSTKVGQELIYRGIVGSTGIISLPDDYLSKIPIPHFPEDLCLELTRLVKESMMAKRESKRLLEEAKNRVEQLIEEAANS